MIWSYLIHLSFNLWRDRDDPRVGEPDNSARPYLRFDDSLWRDLLPAMAKAGINMIVIDLGDGVKYSLHPEIAVENAWTVDRLKQELARMRDLGIEPIPKFNFSTTHDVWLGQYSRMASTAEYYRVCADLIEEAIDIFDKPRLFHLGMDEEAADCQQYQSYVVVRQFDLWWHDLMLLVDTLERKGARAWIWSDYLWHHPDEFFARMPKSILQSNWYYQEDFSPELTQVKGYLDLEEHGYDQVATGSTWRCDTSFSKTVEFCRKHIPPERLLGFLQTVWRPTLEVCRQKHLDAIDQLARARAEFPD